LFGIPDLRTSGSIVPGVTAGDLVQEPRVVGDLSFESIKGASLPVPTVVHVDFNVGSLTFTAELVESAPLTNEAPVQPALQLADSLPEAVLDRGVVGLHAQYYV